jgi:prevent-host-death family protein
MKPISQNIPAGEFKSKCLKIMDEVKHQHKTVIITKHGKPIAKLIPFDETPLSLYGAMAGTVKIKGDIVESTGESWEVEND